MNQVQGKCMSVPWYLEMLMGLKEAEGITLRAEAVWVILTRHAINEVGCDGR